MTAGDGTGGPAPFGPYRRLRLLGEGGHGTVWLAEQANPRREVALKLLRTGGSDPSEQARFRRETALLARLEHPGIARLYEAGVQETDAGPVPFLTMEFVPGQTLDAYVRERAPDLRGRMRLVVELARAVQYAHERGVVHRDLKPANVLVDPQGHPRIVDFGISAAINRAELTQMTQAGAVLGTLPYMAPELLRGDDPGGTAGDVYALGVIAYELACGDAPYPELAGQTSVIAAMRIVAARAPRPLGQRLPAARGDLSTVVMKAMSEDRDLRYPGAGAFADDLERWLASQPVQARPPGALHVLGLFARRHRSLATAAVVVALALVATSVVSLVFAMGEAEARRLAESRLAEREAISAFLVDMLVSADPEGGGTLDVSMREWLGTSEQTYLADADTLPVEARQALSATLGIALLHLGETERALPRLKEARELAAARHGDDSPQALALAVDEALAGASGDREGALASLRALLASPAAAADDALGVSAGIALSTTLESGGEVEEAFAVANAARDRATASLGPDHPLTLNAQHNVASMLKVRGDFAAAEALARDVYERRKARHGEAHSLTLFSRNQLGGILDRLGRTDEAEGIFRDTWTARRSALGDRHPSTLATLNNLTGILIQQGKLDEAQPLLARLVEDTGARFGPDAPRTLMAMNQQAYVLEDLGRLDEAEAVLRRVVAALTRDDAPPHPEQLAPRSNLAMLLSKRGRHAEAIAAMAATVADAQRVMGDDHPYVGIFRSNAGEILLAAGRPAAARVELEAAQAILSARLGPDHARTRANAERLARAGGGR